MGATAEGDSGEFSIGFSVLRHSIPAVFNSSRGGPSGGRSSCQPRGLHRCPDRLAPFRNLGTPLPGWAQSRGCHHRTARDCWHEDSLRLPSFPFPPKRGGKIRPFNMIRHLRRPGHRVTVCSLARSQAGRLKGRHRRPHCHRYEMGRVKNPIQVARMVVRLPLITPSSMGFFFPELVGQGGRSSLTDASTSSSSLFFGGSIR